MSAIRQPRPHLRRKATDPTHSRAYRQLWRVVDGAVFDALYSHPDYLTEKGMHAARASIVKRVTGSVMGFAEQSARGRSGQPAAERVADPANRVAPRTALSAVSKWRAVLLGVARRFSRARAA